MGKDKKAKVRPVTLAEAIEATMGELADGLSEAVFGEKVPRDPQRESVHARMRVQQLEGELTRAKDEIHDRQVNIERLEAERDAALDTAREANREITKRDTRIAELEAQLAQVNPVDLSAMMQRMNEVVVAQIELVQGAGTSVGRVVDIRRLQLAKYTVDHDLEHVQNGDLLRAAVSLIRGHYATWPWGETQFRNILESGERWLHAAALLCAAQDAADAANKAATDPRLTP